jgi:hypothetical protein
MAGIGGFGTTLAGATTGTVGEIVKISLPELGITDIDVSSMDSTDNYMEFIGGSVEPGVIDVEVNYDKTDTATLIGRLRAANEVWTITFPDGSTWVTSGYINKLGGGTAGTNEKIGQMLSIKCSGKPTFTAA